MLEKAETPQWLFGMAHLRSSSLICFPLGKVSSLDIMGMLMIIENPSSSPVVVRDGGMIYRIQLLCGLVTSCFSGLGHLA